MEPTKVIYYRYHHIIDNRKSHIEFLQFFMLRCQYQCSKISERLRVLFKTTILALLNHSCQQDGTERQDRPVLMVISVQIINFTIHNKKQHKININNNLLLINDPQMWFSKSNCSFNHERKMIYANIETTKELLLSFGKNQLLC